MREELYTEFLKGFLQLDGAEPRGRGYRTIPAELEELLRRLKIPEREWPYVTGLKRGSFPQEYLKQRARLQRRGLLLGPWDEAPAEIEEKLFQLFQPEHELMEQHLQEWSAQRSGSFVKVAAGLELEEPLPLCLLIARVLGTQSHSLLLFEKGSRATVILGSPVPKIPPAPLYNEGTEVHVAPGAEATIILLHSVARGATLRSIVRAEVAAGGRLRLIALALLPGRSLGRDLRVGLATGAQAELLAVGLANKDRRIYDWGEIALAGAEGRAEVRLRGATWEGGKQRSFGLISAGAEARGSWGHVEVAGLLLSERAEHEAWPGLATEQDGVELDHEAFVGRVPDEAVEYLRYRGFSPAEAAALVVCSYLEPVLQRLPSPLREETYALARLHCTGGLPKI